MKAIINILTILSIFVIPSFADAQNCQGDNIRVYKGGTGCGCHCMKECVTPAELPVYLANGWNTSGCYKCCPWKNYVEAGTPKTSLDNITPTAEPGSLTLNFTLASDGEVKILVNDLTGRQVCTVADHYFDEAEHELIWDQSGLSPGIYFMTLEAKACKETKMISITE